MPEKFDTSVTPFDRLTSPQQKQLRQALDVAYYREGDTIISANKACHSLFIIIKGVVEERDSNSQGLHSHYTQDDLFDVRAQLSSSSKHDYVALEDTLCYLLSTEIFLSLYHANSDFAAYFDNDLAKRQQLIDTAHQQQNLAEFILTRIDDDHIQPCIVLPAEASIHQATVTMQQQNIDCAFIELKPEPTAEASTSTPTPITDEKIKGHHAIASSHYPSSIGIITRTDLLHAILLDNLPSSHAVGDIATAPVVHVNKGDYLFNATIAMTRQKVKRVLVLAPSKDHASEHKAELKPEHKEEPKQRAASEQKHRIAGMLDLTQILSLFSTHSHVLTLRIARATTIEELSQAAHSQPNLIETLLNNGIHTRFVMELISAVNEQIIEKAFQLTVPQEMQSHCCMVVMGSEGRGEQILKTDQDNALILSDQIDWPECQNIMEKLTQTLIQLGYPPCPGHVMVNNPQWVKSQHAWIAAIRHSKHKGTDESLMSLAMLSDAHPVAGNHTLFSPIKQTLHREMKTQQLLLATFVRPALQFSVPLTLFGKIRKSKQGLDIKKGGVFPIIHGVRTIALEYGITENNTFKRLEQLEHKRILEPDTVSNLSEALKMFIKLRLRHQLNNPDEGSTIHTGNLNRTERDLLRHSLHVVKKFQQWLGFHYQLRD